MNILLIGHITADITPAGEILGGPVSYAGMTLAQSGHNVVVATIASPDTHLFEPLYNAGIDIVNYGEYNGRTTTFVNKYDQLGRRRQTIPFNSRPFYQSEMEDLVARAQGRRVMVLPVADEIPPNMYEVLKPHTELLIAAPQGSTRTWGEDRVVSHKPFSDDHLVGLSRADLLVISNEDMEGFPQDHIDQIIHNTAPTIILTDGMNGAQLYFGDDEIHIPAFQLNKKEKLRENNTGNGDHFVARMATLHPPRNMRETNPDEFRTQMIQAAARASFETALKIMPGEGITDGLGSIRTREYITQWQQDNWGRVESYAREVELSPEIFLDQEIRSRHPEHCTK